MEKVPKAPQEMAAQMVDVYPYFSDYAMPEESAKHLREQAKALQAEVEGLKPFLLSDEELAPKLANIQSRAVESGIWRADKGEEADKRIDYAIQEQKKWGYTDEEATVTALKELRTSGYLDAIRSTRKEQEQTFREPVNEYIGEHRIDAESEKEQIDELLERTVDITTITQDELGTLSADFPSGNFLYHGTGTEQLVRILDTGELASTKALKQQEDEAARAEGRDTGIVRHNSGYEGVSWSMNDIDALPGDRYHLAGFVAAPEAVLGGDTQLAVPSRPSPNEVILIDGKINAKEYYSAKTQLELYKAYERNSVLRGLIDRVTEDSADGPSKLEKLLPRLQVEAFIKTLRDNFTVSDTGTIALSPELLSTTDEDAEIPVAAVWLQGLVDAGRLKGTDFEGMSTSEVIAGISRKNIEQLYTQLYVDTDVYEAISKIEEGVVAVPVEQMYFVAPRKDAETWLKVMARSQHKPAGILLYDDKKIRLENFASLHRGDHTELTAELQSAIKPDNEDYIDYAEVLGTQFSDDMRTGYKHQVIAEKHLASRGAIKKVNGKLICTR